MKVDDTVRRRIMRVAWSVYRAGGYRRFGLALKAAWKQERKAQAYARRLMATARANGGVLAFGDITRSPIRRALTGQAGAGQAAYRAAYTTAVFGR